MLKRIARFAPWLLLLLLAVVNLYLLRQNRQMRGILAKVRVTPAEELKEGTQMPAFGATNLTGETVQISYGPNSPRRLLLFFTPTCPYCRQQFPYWKNILQQAQTTRLEVFGVADAREDKAELAEYLQQMGCAEKAPIPLKILLVSPEVKQQYKLQSTPTTILLTANGIVEKQWHGFWQPAEVPGVASSLGINLSPH